MKIKNGILVLAVALMVAPAPAGAAEPQITPADGAEVNTGKVTVKAWASLSGGKLIVDGVERDSGALEWLLYELDGHTLANGIHKAVFEPLTAEFGDEASTSTFKMAVPAAAPAELIASAEGAKVTVSWNKGPEPDLTGYTVSSSYGSVEVDDCAAARCRAIFDVPATAAGALPVTVRAKRTGAALSAPASGTVQLAGPKPSPSPTAIPSASPSAAVSPSKKPKPSVKPKTTSPAPSSSEPSPSAPAALPSFSIPFPTTPTTSAPPTMPTADLPVLPSVLPSQTETAELVPTSAMEPTSTLFDEDAERVRLVAGGLITMMFFAHFGTWTRRRRVRRAAAIAVLIGGPQVVQGSAHARVATTRDIIDAATEASRQWQTKEPAKAKRRFRLKRRNKAGPAPEPVETSAPAASEDVAATDIFPVVRDSDLQKHDPPAPPPKAEDLPFESGGFWSSVELEEPEPKRPTERKKRGRRRGK